MGIEYQYMLRKGENGPRLDIIDSQVTTERNGTEIKIYLDSYSDLHLFKQEVKKQLSYFDNVFYSEGCEVNNNFELIKGDNWIMTTNQLPFSGLHIVLGKVAYPIDYGILEISVINLPIALTFEIGELDIIQTREDLKYTPKTKEIILSKIELLKQELIDRYEKTPKECATLKEFYKNKNKSPELIFDTDNHSKSICLSQIIENNGFYYKPFNDVGINCKKLPSFDNLFFEYQIKGKFKMKFTHDNLNLGYYLDKASYPLFRINKEHDPKKSRFILDTHKDPFGYPIDIIYFVRKVKAELKQYKYVLNLTDVPKNLWRKQIEVFQKEIQKIVIHSTTSYDKIQITKEWINENKIRKNARDFTLLKVFQYERYKDTWAKKITFNKIDFKIQKNLIQKQSKRNLYLIGDENDYFNNTILFQIFRMFNPGLKKHLKFYELAPTNVKHYKTVKYMTPEKFMKGDTQTFKKSMSLIKLYKSNKKEIELCKKMLRDHKSTAILEILFPSIYKSFLKYSLLFEEIDFFCKEEFLSSDFLLSCYEIAQENNLWDNELEEDWNKLFQQYNDLPNFNLFSFETGLQREDVYLIIAELVYNKNKLMKGNQIPLNIHYKILMNEKFKK